MIYFEKQGERIICQLCQHHCKIPEGQSGICGVNANIGGEYQNLVYGYPGALNIDPVEKKPLYHFQPSTLTLSLGTVGCNFKCPFCQNWQLSQADFKEQGEFVSPEALVRAALNHECHSISFTYNEPTIFYPYSRDTALLAHEQGLKAVFVSNGFESERVLQDMPGTIDAANIDLKSFCDPYYKKELNGGLNQVKEAIRQLVKGGVWVEVTTLLIEEFNDSDAEIHAMAAFLSEEVGRHVPWHLSAFRPQYKMSDHHATEETTIQRACRIATEHGMHYVYAGNVAFDCATQCPGCGAELIRRRGFQVLINRINEGCCPECQRQIEGVWS